MSIVRNTLAVAAASALLTLTAACGAVDKAAVCTDATKAISDYSSQMASSAGNLEGINKANADLAAKLKDISAKADGDLQSALTKMADTWAGFKLDTSDPAASATKLTELSQKATQATQELATACS